MLLIKSRAGLISAVRISCLKGDTTYLARTYKVLFNNCRQISRPLSLIINRGNLNFYSRKIPRLISTIFNNSVIKNSSGSSANFHTTCERRDISGLNEFFDEKENWSVKEVKVGRSWRKEELRLKSNEDLHKLWFVLLKEKNMLLTMEEICKNAYELFPNPERIDKVEDSMENVEEVVRERNRAYMLLETGETGERPKDDVIDFFGREMYMKFTEHNIPEFEHPRIKCNFSFLYPVRTQFNRLLREKLGNTLFAFKKRQEVRVAKIFQRFPNVNLEAVKRKYPEVDVDKIRNSPKSRGHHENHY